MNKELQDILEKVSLLYRRYGIKSITMDDVARELGISKKTLYRYVSDKEDLVRKVVEHIRVCNFSTMRQRSDKKLNAIEDLIEVNRHISEVMKDHSPAYIYDLKKYYPDIFRELMSARRNLMYESMVANIRKGKKEGLYREELDEEIISKLYLLRIENLPDSEIFQEEVMHSTKFFRELFVYHIHGLATERGIRILEEYMPIINEFDKHTTKKPD